MVLLPSQNDWHVHGKFQLILSVVLLTGEKQTDYKIFTVPQITYMFEAVLHQFKQNFSLVHYESKIKSQVHNDP